MQSDWPLKFHLSRSKERRISFGNHAYGPVDRFDTALLWNQSLSWTLGFRGRDSARLKVWIGFRGEASGLLKVRINKLAKLGHFLRHLGSEIPGFTEVVLEIE